MFRPWRAVAVVLVMAEILSLWWLGKTLGFLGLIGYFLLSGVIGVQLIRQSGAGLGRAFSMAQGGFAQPADLSKDTATSLLKIIAGLLVMLPGLISDVVAVLLLLPVTRQKLARLLPFGVAFSSSTQTWREPSATDADIIDVEATEITEPDKRLR